MVNNNSDLKKILIMDYNLDISWMDEPIEKVPGWQGKYKLLCAILFKKKLTYSNMYALTYGLNKLKFKNNERALKERILKDIITLYYYNNNKLPNGVAK